MTAFLFETEVHNVAQAALKLVFLPPQPPKAAFWLAL